ncbi:hypothetical protein R4Z10_11725 [Niallia sp. XMNu-256]|uniref:hypothetical protein n=1 Tax=Niallia sp. XMNu-256 TaxID=3082444 RepID=UPI0030CB02DD
MGGVPADDEGVTGSMHSYMHKMMLSNDQERILKDAIKGFEQFGVQYSEELVRGDLDKNSRQIAEDVIDTSRRHADQLKNFIH